MEYYCSDWLWPITAHRIEYTFRELVLDSVNDPDYRKSLLEDVTVIVGPDRYYKRLTRCDGHLQEVEFTWVNGRERVRFMLDHEELRILDTGVGAGGTESFVTGRLDAMQLIEGSDLPQVPADFDKSFLFMRRGLLEAYAAGASGYSLGFVGGPSSDGSFGGVPCISSKSTVSFDKHKAIFDAWDPVNPLLSNSVGPMRFEVTSVAPPTRGSLVYAFYVFDLKRKNLVDRTRAGKRILSGPLKGYPPLPKARNSHR
jgi:hypothetical protein